MTLDLLFHFRREDGSGENFLPFLPQNSGVFLGREEGLLFPFTVESFGLPNILSLKKKKN